MGISSCTNDLSVSDEKGIHYADVSKGVIHPISESQFFSFVTKEAIGDAKASIYRAFSTKPTTRAYNDEIEITPSGVVIRMPGHKHVDLVRKGKMLLTGTMARQLGLVPGVIYGEVYKR